MHSLLNSVKDTSTDWEGFISNAPSHLCSFLLISEALYHSNIFRGLGICTVWCLLGLINPFQRFRKAFVCFAEFLKFCSDSFLWFPFVRPCPDALISGALIRPFSSHWGSNLVSGVKCASGIADPPYKGGFPSFQLNKSEKAGQLVIRRPTMR